MRPSTALIMYHQITGLGNMNWKGYGSGFRPILGLEELAKITKTCLSLA
jgi:hypothetical protein